jgi:hypothetical protein
MTTLSKEDWLNDPTGAAVAGTTTTVSPTGMAPSAQQQTPSKTSATGGGSTGDWLKNIVPAKPITTTATDADRQLTIAGDREPIPLIYGQDRIGGKVLNVLPNGNAINGDRLILIQVLWCHGIIDSVSSITLNDKPIEEATDLYATFIGSQTNPASALVSAFALLNISYNDSLAGFAYSLIWLPESKFTGALQIAGIVKGQKVYDPRQDAVSNRLLYTEQFDNAYWTKTRASISQNATADPIGGATADALVEDSTATSTHVMSRSVTLTATGTWSFSVYAKKDSRTRIMLGSWDGSVGVDVVFNLNTGAIDVNDADAISATITGVGNLWYRCTITRNCASTATGWYVYLDSGSSGAASTSYSGNGTGRVFLWGAQLRAGSTAGNYVPVGASAGTQVLATPSTWAWSDNPSLCLADFYRASFYGCNKTVDSDTLIAAANANDELVSSEKRRLLNVTFEGEFAARDVSETLRNYAACWAVPGDSGLRLIPDRPTSVITGAYSHDSGMIYGIRVSKKDVGNLPTVMEIVYTNRDTIPWRDESVFIEIDNVDNGVPRRASKIPLPGVNRFSQAKREGIERLNKLRLSDLVAVVDVFDIGIAHEVGDLVTVMAPQVGLTYPKMFRLTDQPELVGVGIWRLTCVEYDPAAYSDNVEVVPTYPDTGLTNPLVPPSTPTGLSYSFEQSGIDILWNRNPELTVSEYELRVGTSWESSSPLLDGTTPTIVGGTSITWPPQPLGTYTILIKARTTLGVESVTAASITFTINAPTLSSIGATLEGANYHLHWTLGTADLPVKFYRIKRDGVTVAEVQATEFSAPVDWAGYSAVSFSVTPISICGCAGVASTVTLTIAAPGQVSSFSGTSVINNVLFYWGHPTTGANKLPVAAYEMRKGSVWASASSMGRKAGDATFTTWTESAGGDFTYWIVPIDTAGNVGTPVSIIVKVSAPNNFKIVDTFDDAFDGTKTNVIVADGSMLAPVYTNETFATHFTNRSWLDPQDQIDLGYELYIQPANSTGTYVNKYSLAAPIGSTMISVTPDMVQVDGTVTVTPKIEIADDYNFTTNVRDLGNVWSAFGSNFQFIRVTLTFGSDDGKDLLRIDALTVNVSLQIETDSGSFAAANFSGTNSTTWYARVNFTKDFIDVDSITVAPKVTSSPPGYQITWIVVFDDQPDPAYFDVIFFNASTGARVTTDFTWQATGVL